MKMPFEGSAIRYYGVLEDCTDLKTPKYKMTRTVGDYPPMKEIAGRDGHVYFYLLDSRNCRCNKDNAPAKRLQGKSSLNFSGLFGYHYQDGKISGFAYGYPSDKKTFGSDEKPNPFYLYKNDGYLFIIHKEANEDRPSSIELLIIEGGRPLVAEYCKSLLMGGYKDKLEQLREVAKEKKDV